MVTTDAGDAPAAGPVGAAARALTAHAIWPLAAVVAATIATERALPLALGVAAALAVARWIATGAPLVRTPADWPILGLALMGGVSLLVTARLDLTGPQVGRLLLGMAFFYGLVAWADTRARLSLVALGFAGAGSVLSLGAPLGVDWALAGLKFAFIPPALYERFVRLGEDTINPNVMAGYLALLLPCVAAPLLFARRRLAVWRQGVHGAALVAMASVLVLTQSRAGLVAAGAGMLALAALRWRRAALPLLILAVAAALVALAFAERLATVVSAGGLPLRLEVWSRGWYMVQDFAFTGIGMGSFPYVTERFYPLVLQPTLPHAHNLILQVAVDLGVPGLLAWLGVLIAVVSVAWRAYRSGLGAGDGALAGLAAGLLAAQVALLVHGMFDAVTWGMVRPAVLVWGLWGAAVAVWRVSEAQARGGANA